MYIFHPRHEFNISQQDNGDADGDVYFVCEDLLTNASKAQGEDYQWLTHWSLELVPKWGQYQNCNNCNKLRPFEEETSWPVSECSCLC